MKMRRHPRSSRRGWFPHCAGGHGEGMTNADMAADTATGPAMGARRRDTRTLAETYFRSWHAKDFDTLRSVLADDVTFRGPLGTADGVDACLKGLETMAGLMTNLEIRHVFVDGADVVTWFDITAGDGPPMPTANWSHVSNGRIDRIQATFDPRPLIGP
jgi:hypothetical protein